MHLKPQIVMKKIKAYMRGVFEVYCREFKIILHDPGVILFITFLPLVYPIIYSLIYNPELVKEVPMVIVDHDRTSRSRELTRRLDACDEVWVTWVRPAVPWTRTSVSRFWRFRKVTPAT